MRWRRSTTKKRRDTQGRRNEEELTEASPRKKGSPCECYIGTSYRNFNQMKELLFTLLLVEHSEVEKQKHVAYGSQE